MTVDQVINAQRGIDPSESVQNVLDQMAQEEEKGEEEGQKEEKRGLGKQEHGKIDSCKNFRNGLKQNQLTTPVSQTSSLNETQIKIKPKEGQTVPGGTDGPDNR